MSKKSRKCKNTAQADRRMQELRDILNTRVPPRVLEIIASGKADDDEWMADRLRWVKSIHPDQLFDEGRVEEWLEKMTEAFSVMSFLPGGTTSALGVKLLGLHFDAEKIAGRKVRTDKREKHSTIIYRQEDATHFLPDTYLASINKMDQQAFQENNVCAVMRSVHPLELRNLPPELPYSVPENIEFVLVLNPATEEHIQEHIKPLAEYRRLFVTEISDTPDGDPIHACVYLTEEQATKLLSHNKQK